MPSKVAQYDLYGKLEKTYENIYNIHSDIYKEQSVRRSCLSGKNYKDKYFRFFEGEPEEEIEVSYLCLIDDIPFVNGASAAKYLGVSRQAFHQARARKQQQIKNKSITWL